MLLYSISFLLGICIIQQLQVLPELIFMQVACITLIFLMILSVYFRHLKHVHLIHAIGIAIAGSLWASYTAQIYLDSRLTEALAGKDVLVTGKVIDIPTVKGHIQRFELNVITLQADDKQTQDLIDHYTVLPSHLRISWYYSKTPLQAGDTWQFLLRLKPPHGFLNGAGFDYEAWLYQQGIHATGYVRKSDLNQRLLPASPYSVDGIRQFLHQQITTLLKDSDYAGLITALAVGSRSHIQPALWDDLIKTGTNHLMAISGLHIGLAALFGYWITRRLLPARLMNYIAAQQVSVGVGGLFALLYALLAGMSIPTQRALIMLIGVAGAILLKRHFRAENVLAMALFVILLIDPVSVLSAGFWFSFLAVAAIFYLVKRASNIEHDHDNVRSLMIYHTKTKLLQWGYLQLVITLVLFPLSLFMFQQTSLISPVANFILVPYISFLVVPLVLLALIFNAVYTPLALLLFELADVLLSFIWPVIQWLAQLPFSHWVHNVSDLSVTLLAMFGVVLLLSNIKKRFRFSGIFFILPLLVLSPSKLPIDYFEMQLLDVGQGLAVIIRTQNHTLVYDTGARFSQELDIGTAVVIPVLRSMGVKTLGKLVISHGDNDHIGGAMSVLKAYPDTHLLGQDIDKLVFKNKQLCLSGQDWQWDGVMFEFLHPDKQQYKKRNNRSCVLKITGPGGSVLLTGDIEKKVEKKLLSEALVANGIDVLLVPHHGSKTSSSHEWVKTLNPKWVLFSAGYRNRYKLPSKAIVQRYRKMGTIDKRQLFSTAVSGAITLGFDPDLGVRLLDQTRINQAKYWNHRLLLY